MHVYMRLSKGQTTPRYCNHTARTIALSLEWHNERSYAVLLTNPTQLLTCIVACSEDGVTAAAAGIRHESMLGRHGDGGSPEPGSQNSVKGWIQLQLIAHTTLHALAAS